MTKKVAAALLAVGLIIGSAKGISIYAHGGNNYGDVQSYNYVVDSWSGVASSGYVKKLHNTSAINNVTSIGGNKAVYSYVRYQDSNKKMVKITNEKRLNAGERTQLSYSNPASWYYGHLTDMKFETGSSVFVDVQVNGSWSPDDKNSYCTM